MFRTVKNTVLVFLILGWLSEFSSATTDKVVCYHGSWSKYRSGNGKFTVDDIDPTLCTHLIYGFVGINTDGTIKILDQALDVTSGNLKNFNALKQKNTALKTLVAVGGWNEGSEKYSAVAASSSLRSTFVQSALNLVQTYGFDGFDIDWEYPGQRGGSTSDIANYAALLKEFRTVFDQYGLLLTAAVAAGASSVDLSYDVPELSNYLDIINVMAYDFHASWDGITGQNAPLYSSSVDRSAATQLLNVDAAIRGWIQRGADPQKLALGLGVYGRSFTLSDASNTAVGALTSGAGNAGPYTLEAGMLGYLEICEKQLEGGWTTVWDEEQKVPYTYKGNQWIGYDNPQSISLKVNYAQSLNLGGVMIWSIETEDFNGICGTKYPLLNAIQSALGTSSSGTSVDDDASQDTNSTATKNEEDASADAPEEESNSDNDTDDSEDSSSSINSSALCISTGYVRDPSDCSTFYYCMLVGSSYVPITQKCSSGLYYDTTSQTCNWPQLVEGC